MIVMFNSSILLKILISFVYIALQTTNNNKQISYYNKNNKLELINPNIKNVYPVKVINRNIKKLAVCDCSAGKLITNDCMRVCRPYVSTVTQNNIQYVKDTKTVTKNHFFPVYQMKTVVVDPGQTPINVLEKTLCSMKKNAKCDDIGKPVVSQSKLENARKVTDFRQIYENKMENSPDEVVGSVQSISSVISNRGIETIINKIDDIPKTKIDQIVQVEYKTDIVPEIKKALEQITITSIQTQTSTITQTQTNNGNTTTELSAENSSTNTQTPSIITQTLSSNTVNSSINTQSPSINTTNTQTPSTNTQTSTTSTTSSSTNTVNSSTNTVNSSVQTSSTPSTSVQTNTATTVTQQVTQTVEKTVTQADTLNKGKLLNRMKPKNAFSNSFKSNKSSQNIYDYEIQKDEDESEQSNNVSPKTKTVVIPEDELNEEYEAPNKYNVQEQRKPYEYDTPNIDEQFQYENIPSPYQQQVVKVIKKPQQRIKTVTEYSKPQKSTVSSISSSISLYDEILSSISPTLENQSNEIQEIKKLLLDLNSAKNYKISVNTSTIGPITSIITETISNLVTKTETKNVTLTNKEVKTLTESQTLTNTQTRTTEKLKTVTVEKTSVNTQILTKTDTVLQKQFLTQTITENKFTNNEEVQTIASITPNLSDTEPANSSIKKETFYEHIKHWFTGFEAHTNLSKPEETIKKDVEVIKANQEEKDKILDELVVKINSILEINQVKTIQENKYDDEFVSALGEKIIKKVENENVFKPITKEVKLEDLVFESIVDITSPKLNNEIEEKESIKNKKTLTKEMEEISKTTLNKKLNKDKKTLTKEIEEVFKTTLNKNPDKDQKTLTKEIEEIFKTTLKKNIEKDIKTNTAEPITRTIKMEESKNTPTREKVYIQGPKETTTAFKTVTEKEMIEKTVTHTDIKEIPSPLKTVTRNEILEKTVTKTDTKEIITPLKTVIQDENSDETVTKTDISTTKELKQEEVKTTAIETKTDSLIIPETSSIFSQYKEEKLPEKTINLELNVLDVKDPEYITKTETLLDTITETFTKEGETVTFTPETSSCIKKTKTNTIPIIIGSKKTKKPNPSTTSTVLVLKTVTEK